MNTEIWGQFPKINVLIVGDIMLDRYWWGSVNRISPEAPVPVVNLTQTSLKAGGAANVAANVAGLGANPFLIGLTGNDAESELLIDVLEQNKISSKFLIKSDNRRTTVKTRVVAHNQQIVRIDQETKFDINEEEEEKIYKIFEQLLSDTHIIIVSDYGKGAISQNLASRLITTAKSKNFKILIDPKGKSFKKYQGATILTPNRFEAAEVFQIDDYTQENVEIAGKNICSDLSLEGLLITQGEDGMTLFQENEVSHLQVTARNVYDVTGAGDTVIASLAVAIGGGADFLEAAKFANLAAGLVVEQIGTTAITKEMLLDLEDKEFS